MSNFVKCDFCKKEIKWMTPYYTFEMSFNNRTDDRDVDVCKSCFKKFIKSVKTGVLEEVQSNE